MTYLHLRFILVVFMSNISAFFYRAISALSSRKTLWSKNHNVERIKGGRTKPFVNLCVKICLFAHHRQHQLTWYFGKQFSQPSHWVLVVCRNEYRQDQKRVRCNAPSSQTDQERRVSSGAVGQEKENGEQTHYNPTIRN